MLSLADDNVYKNFRVTTWQILNQNVWQGRAGPESQVGRAGWKVTRSDDKLGFLSIIVFIEAHWSNYLQSIHNSTL